jgi:hypothetical protein
MKPKKVPCLYGWCHNGDDATARTLAALDEFYNVSKVGSMGETIVVQFPYNQESPDLNGVWFSICDNGGEINVEPINQPAQLQKYYPDGPIIRSMPYTSTLKNITAEVMAYRIFKSMIGENPDWEWGDAPAAAGAKEPMRLIYDGNF